MAPQEEREAFDAEVKFHVGACRGRGKTMKHSGVSSGSGRIFTSSLPAFQKPDWEENGSQDLCTNPERPGCPQSSSWWKHGGNMVETWWKHGGTMWKLIKLAIP